MDDFHERKNHLAISPSRNLLAMYRWLKRLQSVFRLVIFCMPLLATYVHWDFCLLNKAKEFS